MILEKREIKTELDMWDGGDSSDYSKPSDENDDIDMREMKPFTEKEAIDRKQKRKWHVHEH